MNKVEIIGNLTKNPSRIKIAPDNGEISVTRFTVAINRRPLKDTDNENAADYIPCVCFGKTADAVGEYCYSGMKVSVVGRIKTGSYRDRNGETVYTWDVVAEEIEFLSKKKMNESGGEDDSIQQQSNESFEYGDDQMPVSDSSREDMAR